MPILKLLKFKRWREGAIAGLVVACLALLVHWKKTDSELKQAKLAYENPQVKEVVRWKTVTGPVRTVTKIVERPGGERETVIDATTATVTTDYGTETERTPVPTGVILTPHRTDRYLLTFGVNRLSRDLDGKAILVGYGFKNRLDLQAGVVHRNETSPWVFATFRF